MLIVSKFGGSSVSSKESFKKVKDIVLSDENRKVVVSSAIGKENSNDNKITDLLYLLYAHIKYKVDYSHVLTMIKEKFFKIKEGLNLKIDLEKEFDYIIKNVSSEDYLVSRGEYLTSLMLAEFIGYRFVDAKDIISFDYNGKVNYDETKKHIDELIEDDEKVLIPGFYGSYPNGDIKLFKRGGSDITGAILTRCFNASKYENFTDVDGFYVASPQIVDNPKLINEITYDELRELSYMGASVIHEDSIYPVEELNVPIHILNTFNPLSKGTLIKERSDEKTNVITGISGKKNFLSINVTKNKTSNKIDVINDCLNVLKKHDVTIESIPTSIDSFSLVIEENIVKNKIYDLVSELKKNEDIINISIDNEISLIAIVGRNMALKPGISAKIFSILGDNNINVKLISQNTREISIIIGVENKDFTKAIKAVYNGVL